jgi:GT2 family glycosyltransferase
MTADPTVPRIAVILLHWKGDDDTLACLESLRAQQGVQLRLMLTYNGPEAELSPQVRAAVAPEELLFTGGNLGYAGGNNVPLQRALADGEELMLVLNNDTVLAPDCLLHLARALQADPQLGAVAPKSYYLTPPDVIYFAGGRLTPKGYTEHIGIGEPDGPQFDQPANCDWLTGCAILFRGAALRRVGLFEARFFIYFEDTDWSLRARRAGYTLGYVPAARLWHKVSPSMGQTWSPRFLYYYTRNNLWWIQRNFPLPQWPRLFRAALAHIRWLAAQPDIRAAYPAAELEAGIQRGVRHYVLRRFGP